MLKLEIAQDSSKMYLFHLVDPKTKQSIIRSSKPREEEKDARKDFDRVVHALLEHGSEKIESIDTLSGADKYLFTIQSGNHTTLAISRDWSTPELRDGYVGIVFQAVTNSQAGGII